MHLTNGPPFPPNACRYGTPKRHTNDDDDSIQENLDPGHKSLKEMINERIWQCADRSPSSHPLSTARTSSLASGGSAERLG